MSEASDTTLHMAYAEASILLIESVLLALHARGVLSREELLDVVGTALDTKRQYIVTNMHPEISTVAAGILRRLENSLGAVKPDSGAPGRA